MIREFTAYFFVPQLYRKEDGDLVPLSGQEIGQLMAQALEGGAVEKTPWYEPTDRATKEPIIGSAAQVEFDSLVVNLTQLRVEMNQLCCALAVLERKKAEALPYVFKDYQLA